MGILDLVARAHYEGFDPHRLTEECIGQVPRSRDMDSALADLNGSSSLSYVVKKRSAGFVVLRPAEMESGGQVPYGRRDGQWE